jgi:predicted amidophosphoribosyltransferase
MSALQVEATIDEARQVAHAAASERATAESFDQVIKATCPKCGAPVGGGKFCAECGAPLATEKFCAECGKKIPGNVKFCPECGKPQQ